MSYERPQYPSTYRRRPNAPVLIRNVNVLSAAGPELHGTNGLRTIINDYAVRDTTRFWLKMLLYTSAFLVLVLGTLVIFTFDPSIK